MRMTAVGIKPTQLALVELESTLLDHSGKLSLRICHPSRALDSEPRRRSAARPTARGGETCRCLLESSRRQSEGVPVCPCAAFLQKHLYTTCLCSLNRQSTPSVRRRSRAGIPQAAFIAPIPWLGSFAYASVRACTYTNACARVARSRKSAQVRACKNMRWADGCKVMLSGHKTRECSPAWPPGSAAQKKHASHNGGRETRVSSHLIWKQTCCCCAMPPPIMAGRPMPYPLGHGAACIFSPGHSVGVSCRALLRGSHMQMHATGRSHWAPWANARHGEQAVSGRVRRLSKSV